MMKIVKLLVLSFLMLMIASSSFAGSLGSSVMEMFPKDVGEFGCADLSKARELSWFPQFEAQLVPVALYGFERFLAAAQMRPTSSIEEVAWARVASSNAVADSNAGSDPALRGNEQLVAVAIGDFDADAIQLVLTSAKVPSLQVGNFTLYDAGTGSGTSDTFFTFVDWQTIAFGPLNQLERVLTVRSYGEENLLQNEAMMTLIDQANGEGIIWAVLDSPRVASAIGRLIPEATSFPQSQALIGKMKQLLITVKAPSDIEVDLQAKSATAEEAIVLSQLLQAGVLVRRYQTDSSNNPDLAKMLDTISISAKGNLLDISFDLTNEQVTGLIEHNIFAM